VVLTDYDLHAKQGNDFSQSAIDFSKPNWQEPNQIWRDLPGGKIQTLV
jgi:hypothetical protein